MDKSLLDIPIAFYAYAVLGVVLLLIALWAIVAVYAFVMGWLGRSGPEITEYDYGQRAHAWVGEHLHRSQR